MGTPERRGFGELLRGRRLAAGLSQEALAERAGLSVRGISDLERGVRRVPYPDTLQTLARALGVPVSELAGAAAPHLRTAASTTQPELPRLHTPLTGLVGRGRELLEVGRLLRSTRLLTLVGPGGIGKTRLAVEAARRAGGDYADGVAIVELAPLGGAARVPDAVARTLDIQQQRGREPAESIAAALGSRQLLLVLDNCEHVIDACAELANTLLSRCPRLAILATSREPLGISGETIWSVPALTLPDLSQPVSLERLLDSEAARLFVERASAARSSFVVTDETAQPVARLCVQLDGIPLALELAAARVRALSVEQISDRLDDSLRLLVGSGRATPPRHAALQATIAWSHDLLGDDERVFFRRLAVFAGGWSLEAAEAVCWDTPVAVGRILDLLTRLIDKSLVLVPERAGVLRYRLLETIRQFAVEKLVEADEERMCRSRHADWFVNLAEQGEARLAGPQEIVSLDRLEEDHDNLRAALGWSVHRGHGEHALRLASALFRFWDRRGHHVEGRTWLNEALAIGSGAPPILLGKALNASAQLSWVGGDDASAMNLAKAALAACRGAGDGRGVAWALLNLSVAADLQRHSPRAIELSEQSVAAARAVSDEPLLSLALVCLARARRSQGGPDDQRAVAAAEESLAVAREAGSRHATSQALGTLGDLAWRAGDTRRALDMWQRALELRRELRDRRGTANSLERLAQAAAASADPERAVRLFGAAESQRTLIGTLLRYDERASHDRVVADTRSLLGESVFATAWAKGQAMTLAEAIAEALLAGPPATPQGTPRVSDGPLPRGLTMRELQVLRLVAEGQTNRQIARALVLSDRTVKRHLDNIFDKLGVSSRAGATAVAVRSGLA